jgi:hypothetical protein
MKTIFFQVDCVADVRETWEMTVRDEIADGDPSALRDFLMDHLGDDTTFHGEQASNERDREFARILFSTEAYYTREGYPAVRE